MQDLEKRIADLELQVQELPEKIMKLVAETYEKYIDMRTSEQIMEGHATAFREAWRASCAGYSRSVSHE